MSTRLVAAAALAVVAVLPLAPRPASAATPQLAFSPAAVTASVGANVDLDITVSSVDAEPGLGGYDVVIAFDSAVVHVTSLVDAGLVTQGQNIVICDPASIDNAAGTARASCATLPLFGNPGVAVGNPVPLLHAVLSAQAAGTTMLQLDGSALEDPAGGSLSAAFAPGSVTVIEPGAPTATTAPQAPAQSPSPTIGEVTPGTTPAALPAAVQSAPPPAAEPRASTAAPQNVGVASGAIVLPVTGTGRESSPGSLSLRASLMLIVAAAALASALLVGFTATRNTD